MKHFAITSMPTITFESDVNKKSFTISNGEQLYIEVVGPNVHRHIEYTDNNLLYAIAWMNSNIKQFDDVKVIVKKQ